MERFSFVPSHFEHLHYLVTEVVDDLDGDAARLRAVEQA